MSVKPREMLNYRFAESLPTVSVGPVRDVGPALLEFEEVAPIPNRDPTGFYYTVAPV